MGKASGTGLPLIRITNNFMYDSDWNDLTQHAADHTQMGNKHSNKLFGGKKTRFSDFGKSYSSLGNERITI